MENFDKLELSKKYFDFELSKLPKKYAIDKFGITKNFKLDKINPSEQKYLKTLLNYIEASCRKIYK